MPNKTVYLRKGQVETWEKAKGIAETLGVSVSDIISSALATYVTLYESRAEKIRKAIADIVSEGKGA